MIFWSSLYSVLGRSCAKNCPHQERPPALPASPTGTAQSLWSIHLHHAYLQFSHQGSELFVLRTAHLWKDVDPPWRYLTEQPHCTKNPLCFSYAPFWTHDPWQLEMVLLSPWLVFSRMSHNGNDTVWSSVQIGFLHLVIYIYASSTSFCGLTALLFLALETTPQPHSEGLLGCFQGLALWKNKKKKLIYMSICRFLGGHKFSTPFDKYEVYFKAELM